jgi:aerobic-type carbon monoxide dehydrogenase small subunit (CoxS/CutS family)
MPQRNSSTSKAFRVEVTAQGSLLDTTEKCELLEQIFEQLGSEGERRGNSHTQCGNFLCEQDVNPSSKLEI